MDNKKNFIINNSQDMIKSRNHSMDVNSDTDMVQSLDVNGIIIDVSPSWLKKMGYSKEEVIGHFFGEFLIDKSIEETKTAFPHLKDYGFVDNVSLTLKRKDGVLIQAALNGSTKYSETGEMERTYCELRTLDYYMESIDAINQLMNHEKFLKMLLYLKSNITSLLLVKKPFDYIEALGEILLEPTDIYSVVLEAEPENIDMLTEEEHKILAKGRALVNEFGYLGAGKVLLSDYHDTVNQSSEDSKLFTMILNIEDEKMANNERKIIIDFTSSEKMLKEWKNAFINITGVVESVIQSIRTNEENLRLIEKLKKYHG